VALGETGVALRKTGMALEETGVIMQETWLVMREAGIIMRLGHHHHVPSLQTLAVMYLHPFLSLALLYESDEYMIHDFLGRMRWVGCHFFPREGKVATLIETFP
jgi:hypothetical protein